MVVRKVPQRILGVSEPNPNMFGNDPNEKLPNWSNGNWLKSRFHFSFAEYSNPANNNFGVLRVMNDDLVQPKRGFGTHGHSNAEICTYVIAGQLTHQDSMGTAETISRGAVQFMSAGTGVQHSEQNFGDTPLRFIQMWLTPRQRGQRPNYGSATTSEADRKNKWAHLVSDTANRSADSPVQISTDANIFVAEIAAAKGSGKEQVLPLVIAPGRQAYLLCMEGQLTVGGGESKEEAITLAQHDAAEVLDGALLVVETVGGYAHVLVVEMAAQPGSGRRDL